MPTECPPRPHSRLNPSVARVVPLGVLPEAHVQSVGISLARIAKRSSSNVGKCGPNHRQHILPDMSKQVNVVSSLTVDSMS